MYEEKSAVLSTAFFVSVLFPLAEKLCIVNGKDFRKSDNLDIGNKSFSALNALNGVFVNIYTDQLHTVCQLPL